MRRWLLTAVFSALALNVNTAAARAGLAEAGELEAARANARAGGPVSPRDAELLRRYGCSSGTDNPACMRGGYHGQRTYHRRKRTKHRDE